MKWNMNYEMTIELTDEGKRFLRKNKHHSAISVFARDNLKHSLDTGFYTDQAWRIISLFGGNMDLGFSMAVELDDGGIVYES